MLQTTTEVGLNPGLVAGKILLVDNDTDALGIVSAVAKAASMEVITAPNAAKAREIGLAEHPNIVIANLVQPDGSGLPLIRYFTNLDDQIPVIIIAEKTSIEMVANAI